MNTTQTFFRNKAVLITGASSGIGEELALQLAQAGAMVTLAARRKELIEKLARRIVAAGKHRPVVVECDVTRDGDLERAVAESVREFGRLDIAIANAGFGVVGTLKELTIENYRRQFETNVFGVLRTAYAALPEIEKAKGNLVIIGSVAGRIPLPGGSAYGMSKFALRSLANSISPELRQDGVKVTLISPGFVASNIGGVANDGNPRDSVRDPPPTWLVMPTDKAVKQILRAVVQGKPEAIITGHGKILVALERFAPLLLRSMISRRFNNGKAGPRHN